MVELNILISIPFLRDLVNECTIEMVHCGTEKQLVDLMTKPLKLATFGHLKYQLRVCEVQIVN